MQVGIVVDTEYDVLSEVWLDLARACDEVGIHALFRSDHYLPLDRRQSLGSLDAWTSCAAAAALTRRVALGTLMSPVTFRHPAVLAKTAITVDNISHGRCEVGLGIGWNAVEHTAYGLPFPPTAARYEMLEEQLEILHLMWESDMEFDFIGRHYTLRACPALPRPVRKPRLIVGKRARERSIGIAVRWADEYNVTFVTAQEAARVREKLDRACAAGDRSRPLRLSVMTDFVVGESRSDLSEQLAAMSSRHSWVDGEALLAGEATPMIVGSPGHVVERIRDYGAAGVDRVLLKHSNPGNLTPIAVLGRHVLPWLADGIGA